MTSAFRSRVGAAVSQRTFSLSSYPATQFDRLSNGVRVATQKTAGEAASVAVYVDVGSRFESDAQSGALNFLTSMSFQGTPSRAGDAVLSQAAAAGIQLSASAGREHTSFLARSLKGSVNQSVELLADAVQNASLSADAVEVQRGKLLQQIEDSENDHESLVFDHLHGTAFAGTALGRPVLGNLKSVSELTREQLLQFKAEHFTANRLVVVGAGDIDHSAFVQQIEKAFGSLPSKPASGSPVVRQPAVFTGSDVRIRYDDMKLARLAIAYPTVGHTDADSVPLQVAQQLLGSWSHPQVAPFHSQLVLDAVYDPMGVQASRVQSFHHQYADTGLFGVYAETPDQYSVFALTANILDSLTRLSYEIDPPKLAEAKNHLKASLLANLDNSSSVAQEIAKQLLVYGRRIHPSEAAARLDAVDAGAVKKAMRRFCNDADLAMAALGPVWELPDYTWLRRKTYWLRY